VVTPEALGYEISGRGIADVAVTELNTVSGPARAPAAPAHKELRVGGRTAEVRYLDRAGWGADASFGLSEGTQIWPPDYVPVRALTVHHTAGINDDPDPAGTVRAIHYHHAVHQGWGDIGYHALIDERGTVYEGRWSGSDTPILGTRPGPDGRAPMVDAGHVLGFNAGNVGIALLGDFSRRLPTRVARRSLTAVLALLIAIERLDPLEAILGHRDWEATECPGGMFHPLLAAVRGDVARQVG
jgi:hypothetical protein